MDMLIAPQELLWSNRPSSKLWWTEEKPKCADIWSVATWAELAWSCTSADSGWPHRSDSHVHVSPYPSEISQTLKTSMKSTLFWKCAEQSYNVRWKCILVSIWVIDFSQSRVLVIIFKIIDDDWEEDSNNNSLYFLIHSATKKASTPILNQIQGFSTTLAGRVLEKTKRFLQNIQILEAKNQQILNSHNSESVLGYF